ncbi:hypothetical protein ABS315_24605 [Peribacillus frigoritolerans]|uniref:hypothetical protein n=1 Tax=Peribacillus frigoritolerans TaxID=450367 RepID=UPI0034E09A93
MIKRKKGYGDKKTVCETNGTGRYGWKVNCKGKDKVRSKRRNNILTFNKRVEYLLSKLFLLPEGATVGFRGCIKQPSSRLDA